jgi:two-component system LytT family response regulator
MKLKALIVDDEENARILLNQRLNRYFPDIEVKDLCANAKDALLSVIKHKPDLIFLDIQMPDMTGLEFFEHLNELNIPVQAIITTAYSEPEYYKRAIRLGLADYLLKPIMKEELEAAVENVQARISSKLHLQQVNSLVNVLKTEQKIPLATGSSRIFVRPETIVYASSDGKYSKLFFTSLQMETVMIGISELAELLPESAFIKIDRFTIVNRNYVLKVSPRLKLIIFEFGEKQAQMTISHTGAVNLLELMKKE